MQNFFLYLTIVLIWGSTWIVIPFQFGEVANEMSVGYRFALAAVFLYTYAFMTGRKIALPAAAYKFVFLQGSLLFSLNYFLVYYGTAYITTGLVAVVSSTLIVFNAIFERLFFRKEFEARVVIAACIGFTGIALIFWPEVSAMSLQDDTVVGILFVLVATMIASLGNMSAIVNTSRALPLVAVNAHGMAWAGVTSVLIGLLLGKELNFSTSSEYLLSLVYLSLFGSALAFGSYLSLIRRIGAAKTSYSSVAVPIVALCLSTLFEGYQWTGAAVVGIMLTLIGNGLILYRPQKSHIHTHQVHTH
jgi:drug/metabolite transporter (DMT)-like permease